MQVRKITTSNKITAWVPVFSIVLTVLLVFTVGLVGLARDMQSIQRTIYSAHISEARSHAERTIGRIESELQEGIMTLESFRSTKQPTWLLNHWSRTIPGKTDRLYAAVVDSNNLIWAHSEMLRTSEFTPLTLDTNWKGEALQEFGQGVYRITTPTLSPSGPAIDISSNILFQGNVIGSYHAGLVVKWLDEIVWRAQQDSLRGWGLVLLTISIIVVASSSLLFQLGIHTRRLEIALEQAETRRLADLSKLIVGMAHELRNPLNAVRLNLFTTEKVFQGSTRISPDEAIEMIHESVREVERVDELIGQLLGYARADTSKKGNCDARNETHSILQFLKRVHESHGIEIVEMLGDAPVWTTIDARHLRQILLNILNNAKEAIGRDGKIEVSLIKQGPFTQVRVQDSGPGIANDQYDRIFEPFYSTRDDGVGMGLAVVKSLVESAGGKITCKRSWSLGGMDFVIELPTLPIDSIPS